MDAKNLSELENLVWQDLHKINFPPSPWVLPVNPTGYDAVIIGGGMAGLASAFALQRQGITNIHIFDARPDGYEGPWATCARMRTLRSTKELVGPALDLPNLTFRSWFEAQHGPHDWDALGKIPTSQWMEYLKWLRCVLSLPVANQCRLVNIEPHEPTLELTLERSGEIFKVSSRRLVLATGRNGFGGVEIPEFLKSLPQNLYAHTDDPINFEALEGKRIGIIGGGAAGFDAAATALDNNAHEVQILLRRAHIPHVNKFASTTYPGFSEGFYYLSDKERVATIWEGKKDGSPPPVEALFRLRHFPNVKVKLGIGIQKAEFSNGQINLHTSKGSFKFDFLILATGYLVDGSKQPELQSFYPQVKLWGDCMPHFPDPSFALYPYLGPNFEFLGKTPGSAPFLGRIYCFNFAATLSHALLSSDIPAISVGALRLARGIASGFFKENWDLYYRELKDYNIPELDESDFRFFED